MDGPYYMCTLLNSCGTFNVYALCCIRKHLVTQWAVHDVFNNWPHPLLSGCHLSLQLLTSLLAPCTTISPNCRLCRLRSELHNSNFDCIKSLSLNGLKTINLPPTNEYLPLTCVNICRRCNLLVYIPSPVYEWCVDRVNIPAYILHQEECWKSVGRSTRISTHIHSSHLFRPSPHSDSRKPLCDLWRLIVLCWQKIFETTSNN